MISLWNALLCSLELIYDKDSSGSFIGGKNKIHFYLLALCELKFYRLKGEREISCCFFPVGRRSRSLFKAPSLALRRILHRFWFRYEDEFFLDACKLIKAVFESLLIKYLMRFRRENKVNEWKCFKKLQSWFFLFNSKSFFFCCLQGIYLIKTFFQRVQLTSIEFSWKEKLVWLSSK